MNRIIIDGFNLAFRAHYAFQSLSTTSGMLSGCIYGFLTGMRGLKKKYPSFHVMVAWDNEATRKKAVYADYKATRDHFDIGSHIVDLKEILSCFNVTQAEMNGEEADDVIASLVSKYSCEGSKIYIYSSDKDLLQLVKNGRVIAIKPKTGGRPEKIYDEEAVFDDYGVYPSEMACYLSLRGDTSDNIPGVPRVPSKVLASLSHRYCDPNVVYRSLSEEELTDFQRKSLLDSEQQIYLNYSIIKLVEDLGITETKGGPDPDKMMEYLNKYEIKSLSPETYVKAFESESSFNERFSPAAIQNISLF